MKIMGRIFPTEVGRAVERFFPNGNREVTFDPPIPAEEPKPETKKEGPNPPKRAEAL